MRVTADKKDDAYWGLVFRAPLAILLDGVEVQDVVEADDDEGFVVRHKRNKDGSLAVRKGEFVTERIEGAVAFKGVRRIRRA